MSSFRLGGRACCGEDLSVPLAPGPAEVRLAGVENKEKMYEPKQRKKLVRVLTVVAYVFFVSLAAIMLSLYYVFLWDQGLPKQQKRLQQQQQQQLQQQQKLIEHKIAREFIQEQFQRFQLYQHQELLKQYQHQQRLQLPSTTNPPDYTDMTETLDIDIFSDEPPYQIKPTEPLVHHGHRTLPEDNAIPMLYKKGHDASRRSAIGAGENSMHRHSGVGSGT